MRLSAAVLLFAVACANPVPPQTVLMANGDVALQPPPDQDEKTIERHDHVWARGRWTWKDNGWSWIGGHWLDARPGQMWKDGHWEKRGANWHYVEGEWVAGAAPVNVTPE